MHAAYRHTCRCTAIVTWRRSQTDTQASRQACGQAGRQAGRCVCVCTCVTSVHTYIHTYIHAYMCRYVYARTRTHAHERPYTHTHEPPEDLRCYAFPSLCTSHGHDAMEHMSCHLAGSLSRLALQMLKFIKTAPRTNYDQRSRVVWMHSNMSIAEYISDKHHKPSVFHLRVFRGICGAGLIRALGLHSVRKHQHARCRNLPSQPTNLKAVKSIRGSKH